MNLSPFWGMRLVPHEVILAQGSELGDGPPARHRQAPETTARRPAISYGKHDMAFHLRSSLALAAAMCCACVPAHAQLASSATTGSASAAERVTVTGRLNTLPPLSGWDSPARETPVAANRISASDIALSGATRLADLLAFDSSVSDAYNATGYVDYLTVRGFVIDNRYNVRREGLPISGETAIALENKAAVEVLKGTTGLQAGTSAPGGLVNYAVKRPLAREHAEARLQFSSRNTLLAAADVGGRAGDGGGFGWRLNAATERLRPELRNADGQRHLLAAAGEWRFRQLALLEVEAEWSRREQPTQQAFSLLGDRLPAVPDPRLNLNNQRWSLPSAFEGRTGSLRFTHLLGGGWRAVLQAGTQRLRTDDRVAFAYGLYDPITYDCNPCDRFAANGTFSVWDYRSENEQRRTDAVQAEVMGRAVTGSLKHDLRLGMMQSSQRIDLQPQAYNLVGVGNVAGTAVLPADAMPYDPNTNRREKSRELFIQDRVQFNDKFSAWLGLRHTAFERRSVRTNGSRATSYEDGLTTPWVALSLKVTPDLMAFASRGEGAESQVVPNRPSQYTNAGLGLPVLKSVQEEVGVRGGPGALTGRGLQWQATMFRITRPTSNLDACANLGISPCTGRVDGDVQHQGLEAGLQWAASPWWLSVQATVLDAQRRGSTAQPELNGKAPTNVPEQVVRARARWTPAAVPGLALQGVISHEGARQILPDNSKQLPGWTRADAVITWDAPGARTQWLLGVDNLTDRRYWREAPYQFGHAYLYPGAVRALRAGVLIRM